MRQKILSSILVVSLVFSFACTVGARKEITPYASSYLEQYSVSLAADGNGVMSIDMSVDGVSKMSKIGVMEVYIEEKNIQHRILA